ncbi:MAG TPA: hypothetical protein VF939_00490 [Puia sp.]
MHEPIGIYTVIGMGLVIAGLYIVQRKKNAGATPNLAEPQGQDRVSPRES